MAINAELQRTKLYTIVRHLLGSPLISVELEDEMNIIGNRLLTETFFLSIFLKKK
jgi:hypothetical protein